MSKVIFGNISVVIGKDGFHNCLVGVVLCEVVLTCGNISEDDIHLIDRLPMQLCYLTYAPRCQSFRGVADYGYCAAKDEHSYRFRGHLNLSFNGVITGFTVTPASGSEGEALWKITESTSGLLIGDKGYLSQALPSELATVDLFLPTSLRSNMKDSRPKAEVLLGQRVCRLIETVNS